MSLTDKDNLLIATAYRLLGKCGRAEGLANAALIVRACNAHEELRGELQELYDFVAPLRHFDTIEGFEFLDRCATVLRKAQEEVPSEH